MNLGYKLAPSRCYKTHGIRCVIRATRAVKKEAIALLNTLDKQLWRQVIEARRQTIKHAGNEALDRLEPLLVQLRQQQGLREKKRGIFYWKSGAFLHFHKDQNSSNLFADIRIGGEWEWFPVNTEDEQNRLLTQVAIVLGGRDCKELPWIKTEQVKKRASWMN